jgi:hypothetical protein
MLLLALSFIFIVIAATRPGRGKLFRGRYRRQKHPAPRDMLKPISTRTIDPTVGLRDPARPF